METNCIDIKLAATIRQIIQLTSLIKHITKFIMLEHIIKLTVEPLGSAMNHLIFMLRKHMTLLSGQALELIINCEKLNEEIVKLLLLMEPTGEIHFYVNKLNEILIQKNKIQDYHNYCESLFENSPVQSYKKISMLGDVSNTNTLKYLIFDIYNDLPPKLENLNFYRYTKDDIFIVMICNKCNDNHSKELPIIHLVKKQDTLLPNCNFTNDKFKKEMQENYNNLKIGKYFIAFFEYSNKNKLDDVLNDIIKKVTEINK
jgi:hypothetical protein